jgi:hypothetical protein
MPKIKYRDINLGSSRLATVLQANAIISEYEAQGFNLTLRQLYYQFVSRDLIPNSQRAYKQLGGVVNDARLAGLIDWLIIDRTRGLRSLATWDDPSEIVSDAAKQFRNDLWGAQPYRPEVWIEKDALAGVVEGVCNELRVPYFSCRGYTSQSEMWVAAQRLIEYEKNGQEALVLHLGDHDPSGIDMSRDIQDRLALFTDGEVHFERLALNEDQVARYSPPPNPAKTTDSRYGAYTREHGDESWELDALEPSVITDLIRNAIRVNLDSGPWEESLTVELGQRAALADAAGRWGDVVEFLKDGE